jgi:antitoxin component YwqK of YwqJK toxin-antitoxin module
MEKTYFFFLIFIILCNELPAQYTQEIKYKNEPRLKYEKFEKQGQYQNYVQVGKWQDISKNGVVYKEYYFDKNGKPFGIWTFNFPDGTIRKQIEFIDTKIIRFKRFYIGGGDFFEVKLNQTIEDSVYQELQKFEEEIFFNENTSQKIIVDGYDARKYTFQYDPYLATRNLLDFFSSRKINCDIDLWNTKGNLWRKWSYLNGEIIEIYYNYDKKNKLESQTEYKNNKKIKKRKFD